MKCNYLLHSFLIIFCLIFLFPVVWMFFAALIPLDRNLGNPFNWFVPPYTLQNIRNILFGSSILRWTYNSLVVSVGTTLLNITVCSMAAFAFAHIQFVGRKVLYAIVLAGLLIPGEALIIALFTTVKSLRLLDSMPGIILPAIATPLGVIILRGFFQTLPRDLFDSAYMDGAGLIKIFFLIALPLSKPAIATVAIFNFLGNWNSFLWPYIAIFSEELYTLPLGIPAFSNPYTENYILPLTVNLIASLPAIVLFIFVQKQIVQGIRTSGLKG